jgi:hypothetical protein
MSEKVGERFTRLFGRPLWYLLDENNNPYPAPDDDALQMGAWLANVDRRRIARDEWQLEAVTVLLSTVFLVSDHNFAAGGPPVLYETMLFVNGDDLFQDRYRTKEEAAAGHSAVKHIVQPFIDAQDLAGLSAIDWSEYEPPVTVDAAVVVKLLPTAKS